MISKELLSEVLDLPVKGNIWLSKSDNVHFDTDSTHSCCSSYDHITRKTTFPHKAVNIYELAHKCKEWANKNYFQISSSTQIAGSSYAKVYKPSDNGWEEKMFFEDAETEAIFKACEHILENKS